MTPRPRPSHPAASLLEAAQSMLILTAIALFFLTFTVQPFRIPSASMEPTLLVGDFILVDKQFDTPGTYLLPSAALHRGDIVVFHDPVVPTRHLIKRIVALPGDRLHLRAGLLFVNGKPVPEPYAVHRRAPPDFYRDNFPNATQPDPDVDARWWKLVRTTVSHGDLSVPPGTAFVMGDNRNDSLDSRYWGFVPLGAIVGRPFLIYLSLRAPDTDPQGEHPPTPQSLSFSQRFARWNRSLTLVR